MTHNGGGESEHRRTRGKEEDAKQEAVSNVRQQRLRGNPRHGYQLVR